MKRVLLFLTIIYCCGLAIGALAKFNPVYFIGAFVICLGGSIYYLAKGQKVFCLLCLGILSIGIFISSYKLNTLEEQNMVFDGQYVVVHGQICDDVVKYNSMAQYTVYVDAIEHNNTLYPYSCKIKIIDYKNNKNYIVPFNTIHISGKFEGWKQYKNMYHFYYDKFMLKDDVGAVLIADYNEEVASSASNARYLNRAAYNIRSDMECTISKYLNPSSSAMMKGMLFGNISGIGDNDYEGFKKAGIVHIFSVSGYNIWLLYFILSRILLFIKKHEVFKTVFIIILLGLYTLMAGGSISVVRAFIMAAVFLIGRTMNKKPDPLTSLAVSAIIILLLNPLSVLDAGFQLSFVSVWSISTILPELKRLKLNIPNKIKDLVLTSLAVQIGIFPIIIYYFNNFPALSVLSNLLIIPLASVFTVAGVLLCTVGFIPVLAALIGSIINILCNIILGITGFVNYVPYSNINMITPNLIEIAAYYFIIAIVFNMLKIDKKYIKAAKYAAPILIILCIIFETIPGKLIICFIDVGQGDSIFIRTPDKKNILIDGGGRPETSLSRIDIGEDVVKPYLYRQRVDKLDIVVSTHSDDDHIGGLVPVVQSFNTNLFIKPGVSSKDIYRKMENQGTLDTKKVVEVWNGDVIDAGKFVTLHILNPLKQDMEMTDNDASVVIRLVYDDFSVLFTGDIGSAIEEQLLDSEIKSDVLKISHHGSTGSFNKDFYDAVDPDAAVICVGQNSYGHPSSLVIDEIEKRGIRLYRTDANGEIEITTGGGDFEIRTSM